MVQTRDRMGNAPDATAEGADRYGVLAARLTAALYKDWHADKVLLHKALLKMRLDESLWSVLLEKLEEQRDNVLSGGQSSGVVASLALNPYSALTFSVNSPTAAPPAAMGAGHFSGPASGGTQVPLIMFDGESLSGPLTLLPVFVRNLIPGCVITALVQTLIGTKAGLPLLVTLCYFLAR